MRGMIYGMIERGDFDLEDITERIKYFYAAGDITDKDRDELIDMARKKAIEAMGGDPKEEIPALWAALRALQARVEKLEGGKRGGPRRFEKPKGMRDAYGTDEVVEYNDRRYRSKVDNNRWAPDVNPEAWEEVTTDGDEHD